MKKQSFTMNKKTFKVILILVSLLFANIEAAHAGLIHKFKLYIHHEFANWQVLLIVSGFFMFGFLTYIIATPISIGKQRLIWLTSFSFQKDSFESKRKFITKTGNILSNTKA